MGGEDKTEEADPVLIIRWEAIMRVSCYKSASHQVPDMRDHSAYQTVYMKCLLHHKLTVSVKNATPTKQFL